MWPLQLDSRTWHICYTSKTYSFDSHDSRRIWIRRKLTLFDLVVFLWRRVLNYWDLEINKKRKNILVEIFENLNFKWANSIETHQWTKHFLAFYGLYSSGIYGLIRFRIMFLRLEWFMRMWCFFDDVLVTVHVNATATLKFRCILSTSPVDGRIILC